MNTLSGWRPLVLLGMIGLIACPVSAAITPIARYRLGENDPGAALGQVVTNQTRAVIGTNHLTQTATPAYTGTASSSAVRLRSSLGVQFNGTTQFLRSATPFAGTTNRFVIEAWVKPDNLNPGIRIIAHNGVPGVNGWGLFQEGALLGAALGNQTAFGADVAVPGTWTHLAAVFADGTASLYINGLLLGNLLAGAPAPASTQFVVGQGFAGAIDEVRVSTFAAGQFNLGDLLVNQGLAPTLSIARAETNLTISWTPPLPGWILQDATNLTATVWSNSSSGATNPVTVPITGPRRFYRLFKP